MNACDCEQLAVSQLRVLSGKSRLLMNRPHVSLLVAATAALCFAPVAGAVAPAPSYTLQVAGFFQGADVGLVTGMNNSGQTVFIQHWSGTHSYWWDGVQQVELLSGDSSSQSVVTDLDDSGVAVGMRIVGGTTPLAMIWEQGVPRNLGTLGGTRSEAIAINGLGVVAGWSLVPGGGLHLFTWDEGFTDLGPMPDNATCCQDIQAINNAGQIVGHAGTLLDGWVYNGGQYTKLPDLNGGFGSTPRDINNAGLIVGASYPQQANMKPVSWTGAQVQALPLPPGATGGTAYAVNEQNEIVGTTILPNSAPGNLPHATLWKDGTSYLLQDVVANLGDWQLRHAEQINDQGQILVFGYSNTFSFQRLILTPVPEPGAVMLSVIGVSLVIFRARRR